VATLAALAHLAGARGSSTNLTEDNLLRPGRLSRGPAGDVSLPGLSGSIPTNIRPQAAIVFPGFDDDGFAAADGRGANVVGTAQIMNPAADTVLTVRPNEVLVNGKGYSVQNEAQRIALLSSLKQQGTGNPPIVNVDMNVGFEKSPAQNTKQSNWAAEQGKMWASALRDVYPGVQIGGLAQSFGCGPGGKTAPQLDYLVLISPGAMRDTLSEIGQTRTIVFTTEGDFHGPTTIDGPTNVAWVKFDRPEGRDTHSWAARPDNLRQTIGGFTTNLQLGEGVSGATILRGFAENRIPIQASPFTGNRGNFSKGIDTPNRYRPDAGTTHFPRIQPSVPNLPTMPGRVPSVQPLQPNLPTMPRPVPSVQPFQPKYDPPRPIPELRPPRTIRNETYRFKP
jgi:hypothetical protein